MNNAASRNVIPLVLEESMKTENGKAAHME